MEQNDQHLTLLQTLVTLLETRRASLASTGRASRPPRPTRPTPRKATAPRTGTLDPARRTRIPGDAAPLIDLVEIRGFRNLDAEQLRLRRVGVIVGKNNTGKSNLLLPLALISPLEFLRQAKDYALRFGDTGLFPPLLHFLRLPSRERVSSSLQSGFGARLAGHAVAVLFRDRGWAQQLEWFRDGELVASCHLSLGMEHIACFWGSELKRYDGRRMRKTLSHPDVVGFFERLERELLGGIRVLHHNAAADEHTLFDDLEFLLAQEPREDVDINEVLRSACQTFGVPPLTYTEFRGIAFQMLPSPTDVARNEERVRRLQCIRDAIAATVPQTKTVGRQWEQRLGDAIADADGTGEERTTGGGLSMTKSSGLAKSLGSGFRSLLLLWFKLLSADVVIIDEPEAFLHPELQEALARALLADFAGSQVICATHSPVLINAFFDHPDVVLYDLTNGDGERARPIPTSKLVGEIFDSLGTRPSHVLQSNAVIWVEGPSDRLYLRRWIDLWSEREFAEGPDYVCVFYGGRLLKHVTADEHAEWLQLTQINRRVIVVMDSDRRRPADPINATKRRVAQSVEQAAGIAWITAGREIENYIPATVLSALGASLTSDPYADVPHRISQRNRADKIAVARRANAVTTRADLECGPMDLPDQLTRICEQLRLWSGKTAPSASVHPA